jgi:crotonobetainyl-CoA:carnitine CoA-transferase CaiB-like acyl-CoA transferase
MSIREVADDEHLKARGMLRDVEHPEYGTIRLMGNPIRLSDSPLEEIRPPARLGADTDLVLRQYAGLTEAEIRQLRESGVVF